jgi:hypothetical protein
MSIAQFQTMKEIDDYFQGDRVQCLLCGKWFASLGNHVRIHGVGHRQYKLRYGLPLNRGLTASKVHDAMRRVHQDLYSLGVNPLSDEALRLRGSAVSKTMSKSRNLSQPFNKRRQAETHKFSSASVAKTTARDVRAVLARARGEGRTIKDVCGDSDMASCTSFYAQLRRMGKRREDVEESMKGGKQ